MGGCGVAKHEIVRVPFFGWAWWLSGHLLLKRQNRKSAIAAMNSITDDVKRLNMSVWLLPEGTRSRTGDLLAFKKGFVHLALNTGLPVVPVVVHGAGRHWPADRQRLTAGELHIEALEPVATTSWSKERLDEHLDEIREQFQGALDRGPPLPDLAAAPTPAQP
jgi:1-acyl-sn-glycerol-3-phosphate acyltransferase